MLVSRVYDAACSIVLTSRLRVRRVPWSAGNNLLNRMVFLPSFLSCGSKATSTIQAPGLQQIDQSQNALQGGNNAVTSTTKATIEQTLPNEKCRQSGGGKEEEKEEKEEVEVEEDEKVCVVTSAPNGNTSGVSRRRGSVQAMVRALIPPRPSSSPQQTFEEEAEKGEKEEVHSIETASSGSAGGIKRRGSVAALALVQALTPSRPTTQTETDQPIREKKWLWFKVSLVPSEYCFSAC